MTDLAGIADPGNMRRIRARARGRLMSLLASAREEGREEDAERLERWLRAQQGGDDA